jgi:RNA polymerase sigma factor (sigma-70 family)
MALAGDTISFVFARLGRQMDAALAEPLTTSQQDRLIARTVARERRRLLAFIRRWITDAGEAEDVLQETFYELVLAYRMMQPVEQAGGWLLRVARNRIIDRFRRQRARPRQVGAEAANAAQADRGIEDLLPDADADPESALMREMLLAEVAAALGELPPEQRAVFIAHELEGVTFRELAARSGVSINTLLSRKRYATQFLRERLQAAWHDWLMT